MSYVTAGLKFFEYNLYRESGEPVLATRTLEELRAVWPEGPWNDQR